ncbi:hypothetical protein GDO86_006290 [Hymenochirus boettgeri]|uniref:Bcl-2 Bcl-2 homology region 1-3 domain-containing protein n=1 Tax=Hymenochirus boettgeri TaxID=247094 RepID=A0A8T2J5H6_9PIPI|nr:hypothetical protein GDO86_006290 [Hymenochirus boettgeri]
MTDRLAEETSALVEDYLRHCVNPGAEPPLGPAAQTLRRVAGEVLVGNLSSIESCCDRLTAEPKDVLRNVAEQMPLEGGLNWGRVVALIAFAGLLTESRTGEHRPGTPKELAEVLTQFLAVEHREWLQRSGGWDGFYKSFNKNGIRGGQESSAVSNALMAAAGFGLAGLAFILAVR